MPLIDSTSFDDSVSVEIGTSRYQDEDELYLRRLSVYGTVRPTDLKHGPQPLSGHRSLTDILEGWRIPEQGVEVSDERSEVESTSCHGEVQPHELLVKGFHVDERVAPGFRYTVRYVGDEGCLFDGEARRLESIGLGYGRRLTFKSDRLNFNDCFFWSDSRPEGFAFNIEAVKEGDVFTIMDADHQQLGTVEIQQVEFPQVERETLMEDKAVVKTVSVRFACSVKLFHAHHSLVNIDAPEIEVVEGMAEVVKERGSKEARVRCIKDVFFQSLGSCSLHAE